MELEAPLALLTAVWHLSWAPITIGLAGAIHFCLLIPWAHYDDDGW